MGEPITVAAIVQSWSRGGAYAYECVHVPVSKILWFYCFLELVQWIKCRRCLYDRKRHARLSILPFQSLRSDYPRPYQRSSGQCGPHHPPPHLWSMLIVALAYKRPTITCSQMAPHAFGANSGHGISRCLGIRNFSSSHVLGSSLSYPSRIHTSAVKRSMCSRGIDLGTRTHPCSRKWVRCSGVR